jgi:signal transduction histidine kinase
MLTIFSKLLKYRTHNLLAWRLLLYILLCSIFFTFLATIFQLYMDYRKNRELIEARILQIQESYVPGLSESMWDFDNKLIETQLKGILQLPDIQYLEIQNKEGETLMTAGTPQTDTIISRQFPLKHEGKDRDTEIGTLYVVVTLKGVYQRLREKILVILSTQACTVFLLSICILFIFQSLVTRHLTVMARYARELDVHKLDSHLALDRRTPLSSQPDELEQVVMAINDMQERMKMDIVKREKVEEELQQYREHLEKLVKERTAELEQSRKVALNLMQDANEQRQRAEEAQKVAEAANRAKSEFLANMSHELRTPLNAILGFAQLMERDSSLKAVQRDHLGIIGRSGKHLLKLINDVLDMSKIEAGQIILHSQNFDLYRTLTSIEEMIHVRAEAKGLQFTVIRAQDVPQYIKTDEVKLHQVLINLLSNAVKFTEQGEVMLRVINLHPPTPLKGEIASSDDEQNSPFEEGRGCFPYSTSKSPTPVSALPRMRLRRSLIPSGELNTVRPPKKVPDWDWRSVANLFGLWEVILP